MNDTSQDKYCPVIGVLLISIKESFYSLCLNSFSPNIKSQLTDECDIYVMVRIYKFILRSKMLENIKSSNLSSRELYDN